MIKLRLLRFASNIAMIDSMPDISPFLSTYIILGEDIAIVDCGPARAVPHIIEELENSSIDLVRVKYVLLSHIHIDHAGGVGHLLEYLPNAKIVVHPKGAKHLVDPSVLWRKTKEVLGELADYYGEIVPVPKERIITAEEGTTIDLGGSEVVVFETPGHSSHSVTYYLSRERVIFPGDVAGVYLEPWSIYFPTTPFPFNPDKALGSIRKLIDLKPQFICFPHFGCTNNATDYLRKYMGKLELWVKIVKENMEYGDQKILERIMELDYDLASKYDLIKKHKIWRGSIIRSIEGIRKYIEWKSGSQ